MLSVYLQPLSRPTTGAVSGEWKSTDPIPTRQATHRAEAGVSVVEGSGFHLVAIRIAGFR